METRREAVKRWSKEAGAGLLVSFSGLAAASGFLRVHREPPDLPLGLPDCGGGPERQDLNKAP